MGSVGGARVGFFYYPYPLLEPLLQTPAGVPLAGLAYFADAENEPEPRMLVPFRWSSARDYGLARSREILREILEAG